MGNGRTTATKSAFEPLFVGLRGNITNIRTAFKSADQGWAPDCLNVRNLKWSLDLDGTEHFEM